MLGLAAMFARMADEKRQADDDLTRYRMMPGANEPQSKPFMPMRPPGQEGPMAPGAPPVDPRLLARMFEAMQK